MPDRFYAACNIEIFLPLLHDENFKEEKQMTEEKLILNTCTDLNVCLNIK